MTSKELSKLTQKEIRDLFDKRDPELMEYIFKLNKNILSIIDSMDILCNCFNKKEKKCIVETRFTNPYLAKKLLEEPLLNKLDCNMVTVNILEDDSWLKDNFYISYDLANKLGFQSSVDSNRYISINPDPIIIEIFKFVSLRIIKIDRD